MSKLNRTMYYVMDAATGKYVTMEKGDTASFSLHLTSSAAPSETDVVIAKQRLDFWRIKRQESMLVHKTTVETANNFIKSVTPTEVKKTGVEVIMKHNAQRLEFLAGIDLVLVKFAVEEVA